VSAEGGGCFVKRKGPGKKAIGEDGWWGSYQVLKPCQKGHGDPRTGESMGRGHYWAEK